ncbi:hypothetical protein GCM10007884_50330 [Methylobacterium brachythecii]|uniref:Uncharacterized protein n=1 Tax=Methylobacterium brachythecii TaxID=1176177 RepID=A0ABQ6DFG8_9HYPH|nr:hypothetical protein GCM10007884_50330 [Methylobacterium brachythecii]
MRTLPLKRLPDSELLGAGLSQSDAETYAEGVRRGGTLVTVRADDARADRVMSLLQKSGSIDIDERAQGWRAQGWTGGTSGADHAAATGHALTEDDTPLAVPGPAADPDAAPPTRLPPGGIR